MHSPFASVRDGWLAIEARRKVLASEFDEYFSMVPIALANARRLLVEARGLNIKVHHVCFGYRRPGTPSILQHAMGWDWDLDGPNGAFPDPVRPEFGETVHAKPGWGALESTGLREALDSAETRVVLLAGLPFDFGIRQTCLELADCGYQTLVASDATAPLTSAAEGPTRGNLAHGTTKLRSTDEILELLSRLTHKQPVWV